MKTLLTAGAALALAICAAQSATAAPAAAPPPPAGAYTIDKAHTSVTFRVSHLGFSRYTARFAKVRGKLKFDPAHPAAMAVEATIDPRSLELNAPPAGFHDQMMGKSFFEAAKYPAITFRSTKVAVTGPNTAKVTGDFTLHGVTKPVTLDVTYNGGYPPNAMDPGGARVGFSAHGSIKRSAFGMGFGVPAPGSNMGVGDDVEVMIETEFSDGKPPAKK
ncbi:YceI family protein [Phenylobacterium sp.]|jgi:polyisoprenoid-binding protein YceI|uniref:YceI family protein n=1 Tax=Phenylobacterium sp. TaxID=1871053 RepID=UPI002E37945D|nr:YceI family protein [Phenylobacterium sp.]HEX4712873.1 YceI family protein [Phenylobacterium sp.]